MIATEPVGSFYLAEYKAIRDEVILNLTDLRTTERNVAFACAAIWAWSATHSSAPKQLLWLPIVLTVLGAGRCFAYLKGFDRMHEYLLKIETALGTMDAAVKMPEGWEHHPATTNSGTGSKKLFGVDRSGSTISAVVFWGVLLGVSIAAYYEIKPEAPAAKATVTVQCVPSAR